MRERSAGTFIIPRSLSAKDAFVKLRIGRNCGFFYRTDALWGAVIVLEVLRLKARFLLFRR